MDELVEKIRSKQPDAIVVDRAVEGKNQNYLTPENMVPDKMLPYPWESCMILGGGWSFSFDAKMMPTRKVIHMLSDIVAKGGNLLLNIGPGPDGTWYDEAYDRLSGGGGVAPDKRRGHLQHPDDRSVLRRQIALHAGQGRIGIRHLPVRRERETSGGDPGQGFCPRPKAPRSACSGRGKLAEMEIRRERP